MGITSSKHTPVPASTVGQSTVAGRSVFTVYYEDTDFSGFVYHANYLKYFERAREHLLGIPYLKELYLRGVHFVVYKLELTYHSPARHGDDIEVTTSCTFSRSSQLYFTQTARRQSDGAMLVSGEIVAATLNGDNRPIRLPKEVFACLQGLASKR